VKVEGPNTTYRKTHRNTTSANLFDGVRGHVDQRCRYTGGERGKRHACTIAQSVHVRQRAFARFVKEKERAEGRHRAHHGERQKAAKEVAHVDLAAKLLLLNLVRVKAVEDGVCSEARAAARCRLKDQKCGGADEC